MTKYLLTLLLAVQPLIIIGTWQVGRSTMAVDWNNPPEWLTVPTIRQFQSWLGCKKIDGWLCDGCDTPNHSETRDRWNDHAFDKYYTKSGAPSEGKIAGSYRDGGTEALAAR